MDCTPATSINAPQWRTPTCSTPPFLSEFKPNGRDQSGVHGVFQQPWYLPIHSLSAADTAHHLVAQFVGPSARQAEGCLDCGTEHHRDDLPYPVYQTILPRLGRGLFPSARGTTSGASSCPTTRAIRLYSHILSPSRLRTGRWGEIFERTRRHASSLLGQHH